MRVYKLKAFARFQRKERISDHASAKAVNEAEKGLIDADLGFGLIKQRIARTGQGKSGGYRVVIVCRHGDLAVFLYGFAKSDRDDIDDDELENWRQIGRIYLDFDIRSIETAIEAGELTEVAYGRGD